MSFSTSSFITKVVGPQAKQLINNYNIIIDDIVDTYPQASIINTEARARAAFIIPQYCIELGYESMIGQSIDPCLSVQCMPFSLICLSVAIADDIIDVHNTSFKRNMELGCASLAINNYAYNKLLLLSDIQIRSDLSQAISQLIDSILSIGAEEINYRNSKIFSPENYLKITKQKTSCYTRHAFLISTRLVDKYSEYHKAMIQLGNHVGTVFQLIDDLMDVDKDALDEADSITYPMFLKDNDQNMDAIYKIIAAEFDGAINVAKNLPYSSKIVQFLQDIEASINKNELIL